MTRKATRVLIHGGPGLFTLPPRFASGRVGASPGRAPPPVAQPQAPPADREARREGEDVPAAALTDWLLVRCLSEPMARCGASPRRPRVSPPASARQFTAGSPPLSRTLRGEAPHPGPRLTVGHVIATRYAPLPGLTSQHLSGRYCSGKVFLPIAGSETTEVTGCQQHRPRPRHPFTSPRVSIAARRSLAKRRCGGPGEPSRSSPHWPAAQRRRSHGARRPARQSSATRD